jgi:drug/metabolite transporter (DMT)-like permease
MTEPARAADRLAIVIAAVLFSTGGAAVKACQLTGWQVASLRSGLAAATILLLLPAARRRWDARTLVVGVAYASTLTLYVLANKLTTAASTIFLQGTAPLFVALLGPVLLAEALRCRDLLFMAAVSGGMVLFFVGAHPEAPTAPDPLRGNLVALGIGLSWALTITGIRWLARGSGAEGASARAVACGNVIACLLAMPLALPVRSATAVDWAIVSYLGVVQVALAYVLLLRGIARVQALEASLLLLVEPVLNPVWAWIVHGERPGVWALLGGAVILASTTVKTLAERRRA